MRGKKKRKANLISGNNELHKTIQKIVWCEGGVCLSQAIHRDSSEPCHGFISLLTSQSDFEIVTLFDPFFPVMLEQVRP